jgi:hypothetical protein
LVFGNDFYGAVDNFEGCKRLSAKRRGQMLLLPSPLQLVPFFADFLLLFFVLSNF